MLKRIAFAAVLALLAGATKAQQLPAFSHYMYNLQVINPAFTGIRQVPCFSVLHRSQWVGMPGAPVTQSVLAETTLGESVGFGLTMMNDQAGPARTMSFSLDVSYSFKIDRFKRVSLGAKVGGTRTQASLTGLAVFDDQDQSFQADLVNNFSPNAGAGFVYFDEWYYVGVGVPYLLETAYQGNDELGYGALGRLGRHMYVHAGAALETSNGVVFKPSAYVKMTAGTFQVDLTWITEWRNGIWAGGGVRSGDGVRAIGGFKFNRRFLVGYAFDFSISNQMALRHYGSHELMLQYKIMTRLDEFALKPKKI